MNIISYNESRQILRNLRKKDVIKEHADALAKADAEEREKILAQIDREVEEYLKHQIITGH